MTTDTAALQERIEHALWGVTQVYDARDGRGTEVGVHAPVYEVAAAVLPIIAAEVRKARAAAWDEGYEAGMFDTYRLGRDMELTITPAPNPYRETGDRA